MAMAFSDPSMSGRVDEDLVRHVSLDGIRYINSKFRRIYGDPIFAIDSPKGSWRKQAFPYYKANRAKNRKESAIDWKELLRQVDVIKNEIKENFPYKVIEVDHAEADDIIGVLSRKAVANNEEVLIVSGDKDFIQLQADTTLVQQWDKRLDRYVGAEDPKRYLFEHVLKGDTGDGIPNILSPGDSLVNRIRQKPMTQRRLDDFWEDHSLLVKDENIKRRLKENVKIIDLKHTPIDLQIKIVEQYEQPVDVPRNKIREYMISKRLKKLHESINDF